MHIFDFSVSVEKYSANTALNVKFVKATTAENSFASGFVLLFILSSISLREHILLWFNSVDKNSEVLLPIRESLDKIYRNCTNFTRKCFNPQVIA